MRQDEEVIAVKTAAELSALDMGFDITLRYIKKYKYKGEQREKLAEIKSPKCFALKPRSNKLRVYRLSDRYSSYNAPYNYETDDINSYVFSYEELALDQDIVVSRRLTK